MWIPSETKCGDSAVVVIVVLMSLLILVAFVVDGGDVKVEVVELDVGME